MTDRVKARYGHKFGLPAEQVRFFGELTLEQVEEVRRYFTAGLVDVDKWVYAVRRDGKLVWVREKRDYLLERGG